MMASTNGCAELLRDFQAGLTKGRAVPRPGATPSIQGEPGFPRPFNRAQEDDAVLDGWIASLTPDQFARVLRSLARACGGGDGGSGDPER